MHSPHDASGHFSRLSKPGLAPRHSKLIFAAKGIGPNHSFRTPLFTSFFLVWSSSNPRRHAGNHRAFRRCIIFLKGYSNCRPSRVGGYPILLPLASNRPFNAPVCILHSSWPSRSSAFDQDVLDRCFIIIETAMQCHVMQDRFPRL